MERAFYFFEDLQKLFEAKHTEKVFDMLSRNNIKYMIDARGKPIVAKALLDNYGGETREQEKEEFMFAPRMLQGEG